MKRRICKLLGFDIDDFIAADGNTILAQGNTVPTDATAGYAVGCIFQHRDGGEGTALYINEGTEASCDFNAMATLTAAQEALLGATAGTATASMAVILDASKNILGMNRITQGAFASLVQGSGSPLATATPYILGVYADDAGVSIADSVRTILARTLLTVDQTGGSIRSMMGQLKLATGVDLTSGIYTGVQGYLEMAGTHSAKTGSTFSALSASVEIATALTIDSGGEMAGVHVETTGAGTITNNGTCAGVLIDKASGAASWPVGIDINDSITAIDIGDATTGIAFTGTCATGIDLSGGTLTTSIVLDSDARIVSLVEMMIMGMNQAAVDATFAWNDVTQTEAASTFCKSYNHDNTKFVDIASSAAQGEWTAAYQMFPDTEVENDACYFGCATPFGNIYIDIDTVATFGADSITWEYYNGSWTALTLIWDKTDSDDQDGDRPFQEDGNIFFSAPTDWVANEIDSQTAYWIRARCNGTVDFTQIPTTNSAEHKITTIDTGTKMPYAGTVGRGRFSFGTPSSGTADTKVVLYNSTSGACSALSTLTKAKMDPIVADLALTVAKDDVIGFFVCVPDGGGTEYANGTCEMAVTRT